MSILIKGMEMPKSCWDCYFQDCGNCVLNSHKVVDRFILEDSVDNECPLVEVPPHGRLIDVDVRPVVHGEWVVKPDFMMDVINQCSVCGKDFILLDGTAAIGEYHYCPNCGADMKTANEESVNNEA